MQTTMILSLIFLTSLLLLPYLGLQENHTLIEQKGVGFLPVLLPTIPRQTPTSILYQVWLVPTELALEHMLPTKSPPGAAASGSCEWRGVGFSGVRAQLCSYAPRSSARCIVSAHRPLATILITAPGATSLSSALCTEVSMEPFLPRESCLKGQGCEPSAGGDS